MIHLRLDGREVRAQAGETVLAVARRAGVDIPTLCHVEGLPPSQSCFVCVVEVEGSAARLPSCSLPAAEGMRVTTQSPALKTARRVATELLLSEHNAECEAPCELGCPCHWDIAEFMIAAPADPAAAMSIARAGLAIPASLGYVCPAPCENACRRDEVDETLAIRELHRHFAVEEPGPPPTAPATDKRIALVGAGPAALGAAFALQGLGHACTLLFRGPRAGGSLRRSPELPAEVLDAEVALIAAMGATFEANSPVDVARLDRLRADFDAVVLALGEKPDAALIAHAGRRPQAQTRQTSLPGVFAAGAMAARGRLAVRAVADGMAVAESVAQHLRGGPLTGAQRAIVSRYGALDEAETAWLHGVATNRDASQRHLVDDADAATEARRCLECGCREGDGCQLRDVSTQLGAKANAFGGPARPLHTDASHARIVYESHKCILCGACVQTAEAAGADPGIAIVGRGFQAHVAAAFETTLAEALDGPTAEACAAVCPTRALRPKLSWER